MFGKFRVMPAGCMAAALAVLLSAGMAAAEEKEEIILFIAVYSLRLR